MPRAPLFAPSSSSTPVGRQNFTRMLLTAFALASVVATVGCEGKKPVSLEVEKPRELKRAGASQELTVTAKDKKGRPFIGNKPGLEAQSSDASVAEVTVDEEKMKVKVVARNGGRAKITVKAFGLEASTEVVALIPGKVKITNKPKTKLRIGEKPQTVEVAVLDAKGNALEGIDVVYSVSDYCVTVDSNGLVEPVASGVCTVTATAGNQSDSLEFTVR